MNVFPSQPSSCPTAALSPLLSRARAGHSTSPRPDYHQASRGTRNSFPFLFPVQAFLSSPAASTAVSVVQLTADSDQSSNRDARFRLGLTHWAPCERLPLAYLYKVCLRILASTRAKSLRSMIRFLQDPAVPNRLNGRRTAHLPHPETSWSGDSTSTALHAVQHSLRIRQDPRGVFISICWYQQCDASCMSMHMVIPSPGHGVDVARICSRISHSPTPYSFQQQPSLPMA